MMLSLRTPTTALFLFLGLLAGCAAPIDPDGGDAEDGAGALSSPPSARRAADAAATSRTTLTSIRAAYLAATALEPASVPADSQNWLRRQFAGSASVHTVPNAEAPLPRSPSDPDGKKVGRVYAMEYRGTRTAELRRALGAPDGTFTEARFYTLLPSMAAYRSHGVAVWSEPVSPDQEPRWFYLDEGSNAYVELTEPGEAPRRDP